MKMERWRKERKEKGKTEEGASNRLPCGEHLSADYACGFASRGGFGFCLSNLFRFSILGFRISRFGCGQRPR
jgi:hypothetical protein